MVEAGANEVSEQVVGDGIAWAFEQMQPAIALQKELLEKVQPAKLEYQLVLPDDEIQQEVNAWLKERLVKTLENRTQNATK